MTDHSDKQQVSISETNRVIQMFMGLPVTRDRVLFRGGIEKEDWLLHYDSDWNLLMGAWDKLHKELLDLPTIDLLHGPDFTSQMSRAMITGNITEAHRILYESIQWINKQNDNGK